MAGKIDNNGNSWWNWCCCGESQTTSPGEQDPLLTRPINDGSSNEQEETPRHGSPQPSYSSYQTRKDVEASPMK